MILRFAATASLAAVLAAIFIVAVFRQLPWDAAWRWSQHNATFSFFLLTAFPVAVGAFTLTVRAATVMSLPALLRGPLWGLLSLLLLLGLVNVAEDARTATRRVIEPYSFADSSPALAEEQRVRTLVRMGKLAPDDARREYISRQATFASFGDWLSRGSFAQHWAVVLNGLAVSFVATYLWYIVALILARLVTKQPIGAVTQNGLILIWGLLSTWFPLRMYAEWYINFGTIRHVSDSYPAFWVLLAVGIVASVFLAVLRDPAGVIRLFALFTVATTLGLLAVARANTSCFDSIARVALTMGWASFLTVEFLFLLLSLVLVVGWVEGTREGAARPGRPPDPRPPVDPPHNNREVA
jgi:hypothetical protein